MALGVRRLPGTAGIGKIMAVGCGGVRHEGGSDVPPDHRLRPPAYSRSLAISAGANPKVVQRMLGHASAAMTLETYTDLFESDMDSVAQSVSKLWPGEATHPLGTVQKTL